MNNELIFENYKKSLEQKYNAVCFDIDGTLTIKNSKIIDNRAIEMITDLLKHKIPVLFITGRGENGLNDLKENIYDHIKNSGNITEADLKRIYALTNDGARLFYSENASKDAFLSKNVYISTEDELNQLLNVDNMINKLSTNSYYSKYFKVTYSKDMQTGTIINIRMIFNTNNDKIINSIFDSVEEFIAENRCGDIHLTRGFYKNNAVIQIGTATKDKAIERAERIIGVPQNSMIRIGDCGDVRGNDYAMLNCNQGYSVDKISGDISSCFPIYDDEGNILKEIDAILFLIKKAKILPTVCLEKADKKDYIHNFADVEKNIVLGRNRLLNQYNDIINANFNDINGIDSLFDKFSGSIKIPMYEWELLKDNPLKELWSSSKDGNLKYSIRDDNNYLLRGSNTYYYFLSNRISINGKDITSKTDVINWHSNYLEFLEDSFNALAKIDNINGELNKKLLLGILDNCRNALLIIINHKLVSDYFNKNVLLDISSSQNTNFNCIYQNLIRVEYIMSSICFKNNFLINVDDIMECINITKTF